MIFAASFMMMLAAAPSADPVGTGRRTVPLTPRQSGGVVAMWEDHDRGRIGLEAYYTGSQPLDGNPYRYEGRDYFELGALGEIYGLRASSARTARHWFRDAGRRIATLTERQATDLEASRLARRFSRIYRNLVATDWQLAQQASNTAAND